ncbi:MAG: cytochrome bc complex cytochrome b subunit [Gemmatimonadetes bacterium]|nr:cytochrome bc complex cytochrome b subunit [Gemmatimonadota bacterium]NIQ53913.1 cytochrome bc complex cytochrome b subunit [Gemmatimonadota bacterium]NIU74089.1 cytochrome bc complex cytochrome b subunit [Gammaproteobacteria bacterium]NIX44151.1 cytochrome bc complex cytochrome b subunit [Gemmatimonadota bacterium]NIY08375.1 cytochrome bc complex cytochrome b subunit [Gemmatimonadota bacterium]
MSTTTAPPTPPRDTDRPAGGAAGTRIRRLIRWLDDRLGFSALAPLAKKKQVPVHRHSFWYYLGGMALFLFLLQIATGILLLFYYRPSAEGAFESVQFLMAEVEFGWLIRSIHSWGANLMILTLFVHLFSTLLLKAYRKPREITWMSGVALFGLALGLGFTGYLLPWNELAFFATRVGTEIPAVIPLVGDFLKEVLRGGEDITGATLTRFYALHISVLPGLAIVIVGLHLLLVQKHGMSVPPGVEKAGGPRRTVPFFPNFLLRDLVGWLAALALLAAAAAFFPAHLGEKADPFAPAPAGIKPEWYFMFMFQTLKMLPGHILGIDGELVGVAGFGLAGGILLVLPFLDRPGPDGRYRRIWRWLGVLAMVYIVVLTYIGYTVDPTQ